MKRTRSDSRRFWLNIIVVSTFAAILLVLIVYLNTTEPNTKYRKLKMLSEKMQTSATRTRYQWQVENQPPAIMLIHYNKAGREVGRKPVNVAINGLPKVLTGDAQCERLWRVLTNTALQIEGFKIRAKYVAADSDTPNSGAVCRFGYSRGSGFDYVIDRGQVIFNG